MQDVIEKAEKQPNVTIGILVSVAVVVATVIFRVLFGRKKPQVSYLMLWSHHLFTVCSLTLSLTF